MDETHYSISEAGKLVGVESHVLRYWEDELQLEIPRNGKSHRYYTELHIRLFQKIKELKEKGYQLKAIEQVLKKMIDGDEDINPDQVLEQNAVEYTMGPSYMEDDIRMETDRMGFCQRHMKQISDQNNKLGLALVVKTHMDKIIKDVEKAGGQREKPKGLFKKPSQDPVSSYLKELENSCFVCSRIENSFKRYIATIFYLWKQDAAFYIYPK